MAVLVPLGAQLEAVCLQVAEVEAGPVARDVHAPAAPQRLPVQVLRVIIISLCYMSSVSRFDRITFSLKYGGGNSSGGPLLLLHDFLDYALVKFNVQTAVMLSIHFHVYFIFLSFRIFDVFRPAQNRM